MKQIMAIAFNHVYITLQKPITLVMAFVMPIIFTAVLGAAFSDASQADSRTPILIINEDGGQLAPELIEFISQSSVIKPYQADDGEPLPSDGAAALAALDEYQRILIVPAGLSDHLLAGQKTAVSFHVAENNQTNQAAKQEINVAFAKLSSLVTTAKAVTEQAAKQTPFDSADAEAAYFAEMLATTKSRLLDLPVSVRSEIALADDTVATSQIPDGTQQSSPGNLVMFGLITLLSTAIVLVDERNGGTLRRLVVSPLSKPKILAGKTLGPLLIGLIQMAVLILVGQFLFGVPWGRSPVALLIMVIAFDVAIVSLGILLSTVVKTSSQAVAVMVASSMIMAALGGAWWPIDIVPPFMKTIGHLFPSAWAMDGFTDIIVRQAGVVDIWLPATMLLGYAGVFFTLGVWRFRYE